MKWGQYLEIVGEWITKHPYISGGILIAAGLGVVLLLGGSDA